MKTTNQFCERLVHVALVAAIGYLLSAAGGPAAAQCGLDCDKAKCSTLLNQDTGKDKFYLYENDCYGYWNTKTKNNQTPDKLVDNQYKDATGTRDCSQKTGVLNPPNEHVYHGIAVECTGVGDWKPTPFCWDKCKNKS